MSIVLTLTPLHQRLVALALALIPLVAALFWVSSLVSDVTDHHERLGLLKLERANYAALIDNAPEWKRDIDAFRAASAGAQLFYAGNASAAAGPQAETALANIVSSNGGTILHTSLDAARPGDGPSVLRASVAFEASIADLTKILHAVEAARPLLFPQALMVRRPEHAARQGPTKLDVALSVSGFAKSP